MKIFLSIWNPDIIYLYFIQSTLHKSNFTILVKYLIRINNKYLGCPEIFIKFYLGGRFGRGDLSILGVHLASPSLKRVVWISLQPLVAIYVHTLRWS